MFVCLEQDTCRNDTVTLPILASSNAGNYTLKQIFGTDKKLNPASLNEEQLDLTKQHDPVSEKFRTLCFHGKILVSVCQDPLYSLVLSSYT